MASTSATGMTPPIATARLLDALRRSVRRRWWLALVTSAAVVLDWIVGGGAAPLLAVTVVIGLGALANAAAAQSVSRRTLEGWTPLFSPAADLTIVLAAVAITGMPYAMLLLLFVLLPHALDNEPQLMDLLVISSVIGYLGAAWVHAALFADARPAPATLGMGVMFTILAWPLIRGASRWGARVREVHRFSRSLRTLDLTARLPPDADDIGRLVHELNALADDWSAELGNLHGDIQRSESELDTAATDVETLRGMLAESRVALESAIRELDRQRAVIGRLWERGHIVSSTFVTLQTASSQMQRDHERVLSGAREARTTLERVALALATAREAVTSSGTTVHDLQDRSKQIGDTAETLRDVARQTHVLALNAAIEAAQSEANGDSFAVVADEIHALAGVAGQAVRDTVSLTGGLQTDIAGALQAAATGAKLLDTAGSLADEAAMALTHAEASLDRLGEAMATIPGATRTQEPQIAALLEALEESSTTLESAIATARASSRDPSGALDHLRARLSLASGRLKRVHTTAEAFQLRKSEMQQARVEASRTPRDL